jgi:hypothetical protein
MRWATTTKTGPFRGFFLLRRWTLHYHHHQHPQLRHDSKITTTADDGITTSSRPRDIVVDDVSWAGGIFFFSDCFSFTNDISRYLFRLMTAMTTGRQRERRGPRDADISWAVGMSWRQDGRGRWRQRGPRDADVSWARGIFFFSQSFFFILLTIF